MLRRTLLLMTIAAAQLANLYTEQFVGAASTGSQFNYDAAEAKGKRRNVPVDSRTEDEILLPYKRAAVQSNTKDLIRNFSVFGWACRRHLDYVATFDFHSSNGDKGLDRDLELLFYERQKKFIFDAAGRFDWAGGVRVLEAQAMVYGDNGLIALDDGSWQGLASDRVRDSHDVQGLSGRWVHGIKVNDAGRHLAYAVHSRTRSGGFVFDRSIPSGNIVWHGYYDAWEQIRGISPVVSSLNQFRDVYENFDYALMRAKVQQLFAMLLTRKGLQSPGVLSETPSIDGSTVPAAKKKYSVDFGNGPVLLDLDPGDDAKFLESNSPSANFQQFTQLVMMVGLKAFDLPFSFFDESHTNFFGSRGAWLHYERSCEPKRNNLAATQDRMWIRTLQIAIRDGLIKLPRKFPTIADLDWTFVPRGMPWWKPSEEIRGDVMAIAAGLDNPQRICRKRGTGDVFDNIDKLAEVNDYAKKKGVTLSFDAGPNSAPVKRKRAPKKQEPANGGS